MSENFCEGQVIKDRKFQNITKERLKFTDCVFENCTFEDCKITGCSFVNCRFYKCSIISLTSKNSELKSAVFQNCNLIGIHCWNKLLPAGSYAHSIDKVKDCCMKYNSFVEMPFRKFDFSGLFLCCFCENAGPRRKFLRHSGDFRPFALRKATQSVFCPACVIPNPANLAVVEFLFP